MRKIVLLDSGGLDSLIMSRIAKQERAEVIRVYFNIGHDYAWKEIAALEPEVEVIDVSWLNSSGVGKEDNGMNNIFIPGRNMMLAVLAASKYQPDEIWLGALKGEDHVYATDKNERFRELLNSTLGYVFSPFDKIPQLHYPFIERDMGKFEAVSWGLEAGLKNEILRSSSCMSPEEGNCGRCGVCIRRAGIFMQLGLAEKYNVDPWSAAENKKLLLDIIDAELNNDDLHYDKYRRRELIPALKMKFSTDDLIMIRERI